MKPVIKTMSGTAPGTYWRVDYRPDGSPTKLQLQGFVRGTQKDAWAQAERVLDAL